MSINRDFGDVETTEKVYPPCEMVGCKAKETVLSRNHRLCYGHAGLLQEFILTERLKLNLWPPPADEWSAFVESERRFAASERGEAA